MKLAMVSTFRTQCGNAVYTEHLSNGLIKLYDLKVFAEKLQNINTEIPPINNSIKYERCWNRGENFEKLKNKILEFSPDILHIHFVAGLFDMTYDVNSYFQQFIESMKKNNIKIVITLYDIPYENYVPKNQLEKWYSKLDAKFIVQNEIMKNKLKEYYPQVNVRNITGMGQKHTLYDKNFARKKLGLNEKDFILTQLGFYGFDKGMLELINMIPKLKIPNFKLAFVGCLHPQTMDIHKAHVKQSIQTCIKLGVIDNVIFTNKFYLESEEEIDYWCSATDFFILNATAIFSYSSTSTAYKMLFFGKPLLVRDSIRFVDFEDRKHVLKFNENNLLEKFNELYTDVSLQKEISKNEIELSKKNDIESLVKKHVEVYNQC